MMRRTAILAGLILAAAGVARADTAWIEGEHYFALDPAQPTAVPAGKVEIVEVFSYACPACNLFYPVIDKLKATLPPRVKWRFLTKKRFIWRRALRSIPCPHSVNCFG